MPSLSIIIPAYNEEARIGGTLETIRAAWEAGEMKGIDLMQVIVVDDGSSDRTTDIATSWNDRLPVTLLRLPHNRGKGAAIRRGVKEARGDLTLLYDADGAAPIREVLKLHAEMERSNADIVIGSRVLGKEDALVTMRRHRRIIGRVYHALCAMLVPGIRDTACGCKLFKTDRAHELFSVQRIDRFAFDVEVLAIAIARGQRIREVALCWSAIPESKVRLFRDGLQMFACLIALYVRRMRGTLAGEKA